MKKRLNNIGVTLVELIVTIAIMTLVGGAITSFIIVTQKNYTNGSAETDLQYEAQMVVNQLQDLMIDTARGISYQYDAEAMSSDEYILDDSLIPDGATVKTKSLYIYDQTEYYLLKWDDTTDEIRFFEYDKDGNLKDGIAANGELLAQYVEGFSVDLRELATNRTVSYVINLKKTASGRTYSTSHKIKLRNEVLVNADRGTIYVPVPEEVVADKIIVNPDKLYLWPGDNYAMSHRVASTGNGIPSQSVNWIIEGHVDADGNQITSTTIDPATDVLSTTVDAIKDTDHTFTVYATKAVTDGVIDSRDTQTATKVNIRNITGIIASDSQGATSSVTSNIIKSGSTGVTATATILGEYLDGLSTAERGGASIKVETTCGMKLEDFITINSIDENTGNVNFSVKDDNALNFDKNKYSFKITFTVRKAGFTNLPDNKSICVINYTVQKRGDFDIIVDGSWKRNGSLHLNFSNFQVPDGEESPVVETEDGLFFSEKNNNKLIQVYVTFRDSTVRGNDGKYKTCYNVSDSGQEYGTYCISNYFTKVKSSKSDVFVSRQDGTPFAVITDAERGADINLNKMELFLYPYTKGITEADILPTGFSSAFPYYDISYNSNTMSYGANIAELTVVIYYNDKKYKSSIEVPIEQTAISFARFSTDKSGKLLWCENDMDSDNYLKIFVCKDDYVTTGGNKKKIGSTLVSYKLGGGFNSSAEWSDLFKGLDILDGSRFVAILGDAQNNKRYQFASIVPEASNDKQTTYINFTFNSDVVDLKDNERITVKYEYNPLFGTDNWRNSWGMKDKLTNNSAISSADYETYEELYDAIKGCPGGIQFIIKSANIELDNVTVRPSSGYIPSPTEFIELENEGDYYFSYSASGAKYYNISATERYKIEKDENGNLILGYEYQKNPNDWSSPWGKRGLHWDADAQKWILNNVVIPDTDKRQRPTVLYCPDPTVNESSYTAAGYEKVGNDYIYRINGDREYYKLLRYKYNNSYYAYEIQYVNTTSGKFGWGDAVLYWDTGEKVWKQYDANVNFTGEWGGNKADILYCPSPEMITSQVGGVNLGIVQKNGNKYYYQIGVNSYYEYDADKGTLKYLVTDNLDNIKDRNYPGNWQKKSLKWNWFTHVWEEKLHYALDLPSGWEKPPYLYAPAPDSELWIAWDNGSHYNKYYYIWLNDTEYFLLEKTSNSTNLMYLADRGYRQEYLWYNKLHWDSKSQTYKK